MTVISPHIIRKVLQNGNLLCTTPVFFYKPSKSHLIYMAVEDIVL